MLEIQMRMLHGSLDDGDAVLEIPGVLRSDIVEWHRLMVWTISFCSSFLHAFFFHYDRVKYLT